LAELTDIFSDEKETDTIRGRKVSVKTISNLKNFSDSDYENCIKNIVCKRCKLNNSCNDLKSNVVNEYKILSNLNIDIMMIAVPKQYLSYKKAFSKQNCNVLRPQSEYYCEIKLKDNLTVMSYL